MLRSWRILEDAMTAQGVNIKRFSTSQVPPCEVHFLSCGTTSDCQACPFLPEFAYGFGGAARSRSV